MRRTSSARSRARLGNKNAKQIVRQRFAAHLAGQRSPHLAFRVTSVSAVLSPITSATKPAYRSHSCLTIASLGGAAFPDNPAPIPLIIAPKAPPPAAGGLAASARRLTLSTCASICLDSIGHVLSLRPKTSGSSGEQPRSSTSRKSRSMRRMMHRSESVGGGASGSRRVSSWAYREQGKTSQKWSSTLVGLRAVLT